jgi:hypothetical protein
MASKQNRPILRRFWWIGILVGLALPIALIPAHLYVARWALLASPLAHSNPTPEAHKYIDTIINAAFATCLLAAISGPFIFFRSVTAAVGTAIVYVPALLFVLVFVQLGMGCSILPPAAGACP